MLEPITSGDIEAMRGLAQRRHDLNAKLGHKYRHNGMESVLAHTVGELGHLVVRRILDKNNIEYESSVPLTKDFTKIRQDIRCEGLEIGVKTMKRRTIGFAQEYYYYPDKKSTNKRILGYPDFLIQVVVSFDEMLAKVLGYTSKFVIEDSSSKPLHGEMAHHIPARRFANIDLLLEYLKLRRKWRTNAHKKEK